MREYNEFIKDLKELISIKSVSANQDGDAPFGQEVKKALVYFLKLADKFGFETINYQNYAGEVVFGEGEEIGIMGHLDVVPAGDGWESDPFCLIEKDGRLFGRGILDDKTPLLMCLYALKQLKDEGITPKRKIRLFVGCDEERGWQDAEHLKKVTKMPDYGFSPDGDFPVSYAEKGMVIIKIELNQLKKFKYLDCGTVVNAVCGKAKILENNKVIEFNGVSSHGAYPEKGKNAIKEMFNYISNSGENVGNAKNLFLGNGIYSQYSSQEGEITISPNLIKVEGDKAYLVCDCRYPHPFTMEDVKSILKDLKITATYSEKHNVQYVEKEGWFVSTLINAYSEIMGEAEPMAERGSTFARVFNKGVAFGPEFGDEDSTIHQPNENASIKKLMKTYDIYYNAIKSLLRK